MWIREAAPEQVTELFHNYQHALGICGKGSESGSWKESAQSGTPAESAESREYFAQPGEADWGC